MEENEILENEDAATDTAQEALLDRVLKAEAAAEKWKNRFKSAKSTKEESVEQVNTSVDEDLVNRKVAEALFYQNNESARAAQTDIVSLQKQYNLPVEEAYRLHIAKTNPSQLVQTQKTTGVGGYTDMQVQDEDTPESIQNMSQAEFEKKYM